MVGSRKYFVYTDDRGEDFAVNLDESNVEAVNGAIQDFPDTPPTVYELPRNIKPRTLVYKSVDGTITKRVVALTEAIYNGAPTNLASVAFPDLGASLRLKEVVPERIRAPFGYDTGQQDGDAT